MAGIKENFSAASQMQTLSTFPLGHSHLTCLALLQKFFGQVPKLFLRHFSDLGISIFSLFLGVVKRGPCTSRAKRVFSVNLVVKEELNLSLEISDF